MNRVRSLMMQKVDSDKDARQVGILCPTSIHSPRCGDFFEFCRVTCQLRCAKRSYIASHLHTSMPSMLFIATCFAI